MSGFKRRIELPWGWAESASPRDVRVGKNYVPEAVNVTFSGVDGQPALEMALAVIDGRPQCRELRVRSHDDGREVRQLDLDSIRLENWITEVYAEFAMPILSEENGTLKLAWVVSTDEHHLDAAQAMQRARRGKGPRKLNSAYLTRVAGIYRENIDHAPTKAVAAAFGVEHRQAAHYVQEARRAGLLPPTTPGKKRA